MSLRINHNLSAINGHNMLQRNDSALSKSLERLSSGMRINRAADDAAGLVISEQMRAQIAGLGQAINNSEIAVSFAQTAEGALTEMNTLLIKARELALHAGNTAVNDSTQLQADQTELDNIIESVTRISANTQFGTKKILDGTLDGSNNLSVGLDRVRAGNLANNPSVAIGPVTLQVNPGAREAMTLIGSNATDTDYVFSGTVTGVTLGANRVNSGVSVTLAINSQVVAYVTTGLQDATTVATRLDALAQPLGFTVAANANGEMNITRIAVGSADFTSQVTFVRSATQQVAGINERVTATLAVTSPSTSSEAASVIFSGLSALSQLQSTTNVNSGTTFSYVLQTATGVTYSGSVAVNSSTAMSTVLSNIQASIQGQGTFSGSTLTYDGSLGEKLRFGLARGFDDIATDFNFSLTVDYQNNALTNSQANAIDMAAAVFVTGTDATFLTGVGGGTDVQGNALVGASYLQSGAALNLTISGTTLVFTGARTVSTLATAMQTQINALGGEFSNVRVAFLTGGVALNALAGQQNLVGSTAGGFRGFLVYNTDGAKLSVSLAVDQTQGNDVVLGDAVLGVGAKAGATLDLTTVAQGRVDNQMTQTAHAAASIASVSGNDVITSGVDVSALMTTSNGVILNLISTSSSITGGSTLALTPAMQTLGYNDFTADINQTLSLAGGLSTFDLNNGAVFQVGANVGQRVGFVIDSVAATELGRNATGAGSLRSLNDLHSSQQGALLNGHSVEALSVIDATISEITDLRGKLGALQSNTLESGLNSLRASFENLTSAESTIRDVDFAQESSNFTRNQILVQSATAMLAQANQLPQSVLKLLQ